MNDILSFALLVIFILVPFGLVVIRVRYKNTIVARMAVLAFLSSMGVGIVAFAVAKIGNTSLWWAIPTCLAYLLAGNRITVYYVQRPIQNLSDKIDKLSQGHLDQVIDQDLLKRGDEVGAIAMKVDNLLATLKTICNEIKQGTSVVADSGLVVSDSSQALAQNADEQSATVQQVSASVEEMSAGIEQITEKSKLAESVTQSSVENMKTLSESARASADSVDEITRKIAIINDIAFQTNILALNAAVEAARAGEYGKGFAVVASEVRKLAERSKAAADEINSLSQATVSTTRQTNELLEKMVADSDQTASYVREIMYSNLELNSGTTQISQAIQQLNATIVQHAASTQKLAQSACQLNDQSERLSESVSFFK